MLGNTKTTLAFAATTLLGAGLLAATIGAPSDEADIEDGTAEITPVPTKDPAKLAASDEITDDSDMSEQSDYDWDDQDEWVDDTKGFDPVPLGVESATSDDSDDDIESNPVAIDPFDANGNYDEDDDSDEADDGDYQSGSSPFGDAQIDQGPKPRVRRINPPQDYEPDFD